MKLFRLIFLTAAAVGLQSCYVTAQTPTAGSVGFTVKNAGAGSSIQWAAPGTPPSVFGVAEGGAISNFPLDGDSFEIEDGVLKVIGGSGSGTVTSVAASGGTTGFTFTGGPITGSGTLTLAVSNATTIRTSLGLGTLATQNGTISDYLTISSASSTYAALGGSYANPTWITSLAWSKISGAPSFLTAVDWGDIEGTLSNQTDLQNALNAKASLSGASFTGDVTTTGHITATDHIHSFDQISANGDIVAGDQIVFGNSGHYLQSGGGEFNICIFPDKGGVTRYVPLVSDSGGLVSLSADATGTLPIANGGTGATTASNARTALGLAIGSDVQAYNANTTTLGNTTTGTGSIVRATSPTLITPVIGAATGTSLSLSGSISASNFSGSSSGTNTGDQTVTLTGDVTGSGTGSFSTTLANSGVTAGTYTNATVTVDGKGRVTSASNGSGGGGGGGVVAQVMTAFKGDPQTATTVNGSWTDVTDLVFTVTLTDSSHSVLLDAQVSVGYVNGSSGTALRWVRKGSPDVALSVATDTAGRWETGSGPTIANDNNATFTNNVKAVDTPGSVGPHTYQLQFCASAVTTATAYINRSSSDSNTNAYSSRPSSMAFLWEVDL